MYPLTSHTLVGLFGGNTMTHISGKDESNLRPRSHQPSATDMCVAQYYRCPDGYVRIDVREPLSSESGYFRFGNDVVCYGQLGKGQPSNTSIGNLVDTMDHSIVERGIAYLPFDPAQVADNLRYELYPNGLSHGSAMCDSVLETIYYSLRSLMPGALRRFLQGSDLWVTDWRSWKIYRLKLFRISIMNSISKLNATRWVIQY